MELAMSPAFTFIIYLMDSLYLMLGVLCKRMCTKNKEEAHLQNP